MQHNTTSLAAASEMSTVFAVAVESDSSGMVDWYFDLPKAQTHFNNQVKAFSDLSGERITLFPVAVPNGISNEKVTALVDEAMHEMSYSPIQTHLTTEGFLPTPAGATTQEVLDVMMQDVVGEYDVPEVVVEWAWVESNASFKHVKNGTDGIWEFVLNLSNEFKDVPERIKPVLLNAQANNVSYLIFHQGT